MKLQKKNAWLKTQGGPSVFHLSSWYEGVETWWERTDSQEVGKQESIKAKWYEKDIGEGLQTLMGCYIYLGSGVISLLSNV